MAVIKTTLAVLALASSGVDAVRVRAQDSKDTEKDLTSQIEALKTEITTASAKDTNDFLHEFRQVTEEAFMKVDTEYTYTTSKAKATKKEQPSAAAPAAPATGAKEKTELEIPIPSSDDLFKIGSVTLKELCTTFKKKVLDAAKTDEAEPSGEQKEAPESVAECTPGQIKSLFEKSFQKEIMEMKKAQKIWKNIPEETKEKIVALQEELTELRLAILPSLPLTSQSPSATPSPAQIKQIAEKTAELEQLSPAEVSETQPEVLARLEKEKASVLAFIAALDKIEFSLTTEDIERDFNALISALNDTVVVSQDNSGLKLWQWALIVLVIVAVIAAIFFFMQKGEENAVDESEEALIDEETGATNDDH